MPKARAPEHLDNDEPVAKPSARTGAGTRVRVKGDSLQFAKAKAAEALAKRQNENERTVLQQLLPLWNEEMRGVPNPMIRSGLFGTKSQSSRELVRDKQVASLSNYVIVFKGEELLQDDLSVWMALLHRASKQAFGDTILFSGYEIVQDLGWRMHSESYERVKQSISRLKTNELKIQIKSGKTGYAGSLIREYMWDAQGPDGNRKWMVRLESTLAELFRDDTVTFLQWEQRKQIGSRAALAQWLHAYYTSHRDPFPLTISKIHEMCGSEMKELRYFRRQVILALERLKSIGFLVGFSIQGETVVVKKAIAPILNIKGAATQRLLT